MDSDIKKLQEENEKLRHAIKLLKDHIKLLEQRHVAATNLAYSLLIK